MENQDYKEYDTVMIRLSSGREQEFAIMEEFDFEEKHYIVVSAVIKEEIQEGLYIYRSVETDGELEISRIEDAGEFERVSAYFEAK